MQLHRIHRQSLRVRTRSAEVAFAWRTQLRGRLDSEVSQAFERAFDAYGTRDMVVHIPRLTLEVRASSVDEFLDQLAGIVTRALGEATAHCAQPSPSARAARSTPTGEAWRVALLVYLESGRLPWAHEALGLEATLTALREQAELLAQPGWISGLPIPVDLELRARLTWTLRWLQLLTPETRDTLRDGSVPLPSEHHPAAIEAATSADSSPRYQRPVPAGAQPAEAVALRIVLRHAMTHEPRARGAALLKSAFGDPELARYVAGGATSLLQTVGITGNRPGVVAQQDACVDDSQPPPLAEEAPLAPNPMTLEPARTSIAPAHGLIVQDAGIVLLHPFLSRLFAATQVTDADKRLPPAALPRAAALLHYLIAGRAEAYEFELGVVKVLLGLAPGDPLPIDLDCLDQHGREQADALLAAVIGHWRALGKTSVAGLRASFLERRGMVREASCGWQLQVEARPFDVLVAQLPWAISIVKLPWMKRVLHTTWPT